MPSLILFRDVEYTFDFYDENAVFDFYDKDGNLITQYDSPNYTNQFRVKFDFTIPNEITYRLRNGKLHGAVHLRNNNQINGRVSLYGFTQNSIVYCVNEYGEEIFQSRTDKNGIYVGSLIQNQNYDKLEFPIIAHVYEDLGENIQVLLQHQEDVYF